MRNYWSWRPSGAEPRPFIKAYNMSQQRRLAYNQMEVKSRKIHHGQGGTGRGWAGRDGARLGGAGQGGGRPDTSHNCRATPSEL